MDRDSLVEIISQLSTEEQNVVREFIEFLKTKDHKTVGIPFLSVIDEFISAHPDLLRRLAK